MINIFKLKTTMGIDARVTDKSTPKERDLSQCEVVSEVTVDMILTDLALGRNKDAIAARYAFRDEASGETLPLERWMVDAMFKDPALVGRTPTRGRVLPFAFKGSEDTPVKAINTVKPLVRAGKKEEEEIEDTDNVTPPPTEEGTNDVDPTKENLPCAEDFDMEDTTDAPQSDAGEQTETEDPIEVG